METQQYRYSPFLLWLNYILCQQYKCLLLPWTCSNVFPLKCCRAVVYFFLLSTIQTYIVLYVKLPTFLSDFDQIWSFSTDFRKSSTKSNFTKISEMRSVLIHLARKTDGRTCRRKYAFFFATYANPPKRGYFLLPYFTSALPIFYFV